MQHLVRSGCQGLRALPVVMHVLYMLTCGALCSYSRMTAEEIMLDRYSSKLGTLRLPNHAVHAVRTVQLLHHDC
jgi:hypothetical protein